MMKLGSVELFLLLLVLSGGRPPAAAAAPVRRGRWVPPPGEDPLPVVPLPPNPLGTPNG